MRTGHLSAPKNKRVLVSFRDGTKIEDHFIKRESNLIYFRKIGPIESKRLKCVIIYKGPSLK